VVEGSGIFDRIVCGVDGTPEALEAARQAERLRSPEGTLRLVAVEDPSTAVHAGYAASRVLDDLDAIAREGLERATAEVGPTSAELRAGHPAQLLLDELEESNATLVAVGPRGHSRAVGILLGSVATELLHNAACATLFAREARFGEFPSSVIVGVDGSPESLAAAAVAASIAERFGSERVTVAAAGGRDIQLEAIQKLGSDVVVDPGRPVDTLTELSREADLLVVGSRGLHGVKSLGSVSERVAHHAQCSVLIVR
jgi:nucleotide-binding universal stress UspA family protein